MQLDFPHQPHFTKAQVKRHQIPLKRQYAPFQKRAGFRAIKILACAYITVSLLGQALLLVSVAVGVVPSSFAVPALAVRTCAAATTQIANGRNRGQRRYALIKSSCLRSTTSSYSMINSDVIATKMSWFPGPKLPELFEPVLVVFDLLFE